MEEVMYNKDGVRKAELLFAQEFGAPTSDPVEQGLFENLESTDNGVSDIVHEHPTPDEQKVDKSFSRKKKVSSSKKGNIDEKKLVNLVLDKETLFKCDLLEKYYDQTFSTLIRGLISKEFDSKKKEIRRMIEESLKYFDC